MTAISDEAGSSEVTNLEEARSSDVTILYESGSSNVTILDEAFGIREFKAVILADFKLITKKN